jgi:tripartite-type tricarboxylate transporter receptor subunit TctC
LRALATADKNRHPQFPDVPTLDEVGIPDVHVGAYVGLLGPAGLPKEIVTRLQKELEEMYKDPKNVEKLKNIGFEPSLLLGDGYKDYTVKDLARWTDVAKVANIALD